MKETLRPAEQSLRVVSFGSVEDMVADLRECPPDRGVVRIETCLKDGQAGRYGIGLRVASVVLTARRRDELLVANCVTTYVQTMNGRSFCEEDGRLADENNKEAKSILEEQLQEAGLSVRPGSYSLPDSLALYRATSQRITFNKERRVAARGEKDL